MDTQQSLPRRRFLKGEFFHSLQSQTVQQQGFVGIRPPWAVAEAQFVAHCDRCGECVRACETGILVKGEGGFPEVRFDEGECTFCRQCVEVCPQPVFRAAEERPWAHKVRIAESCLSLRGVECRSCEDSCEMRAIRFKPALRQVAQVQLNVEACNGCGNCLRACPVGAICIEFPNNHAQALDSVDLEHG